MPSAKTSHLPHDFQRGHIYISCTMKRLKIEIMESLLFPHKNNVEVARATIELLPEQRPQHIGDLIDPENEKDNEDQETEGVLPDEEFAARDLELIEGEKPIMRSERTIYKRMDISNHDEMLNMARGLDEDQRYTFDIIIKYVKQMRACWNSGMKSPKAPLLKVHGGAGCGKSWLMMVGSLILLIIHHHTSCVFPTNFR